MGKFCPSLQSDWAFFWPEYSENAMVMIVTAWIKLALNPQHINLYFLNSANGEKHSRAFAF